VTKLEKGNHRIDVMQSASKSAIAPLLRFHSTIPMNYISAGTIKSFYPNLFFDRIGVIQRDANYRGFDWMIKYESRGFDIIVEQSELPPAYTDCADRAYKRPRYGVCSLLVRKSDDRYTMAVKAAYRDEAGEHKYFDESIEPIVWLLGPFSSTHSLCQPTECIVEDWRLPAQFDLTARFIHKYTSNSM
jgi:hypothetical protein